MKAKEWVNQTEVNIIKVAPIKNKALCLYLKYLDIKKNPNIIVIDTEIIVIIPLNKSKSVNSAISFSIFLYNLFITTRKLVMLRIFKLTF